jgi:uncharacterized protein YlaN (UPF0358 family)
MGSVKKCFVCEELVAPDNYELNKEVNMPVCSNCIGTENEKKKIEELLDSLAEGLICGCI